ncbi:MAG: hypothetical protein AABM43_12120 [Actinomycetota bacterium]
MIERSCPQCGDSFEPRTGNQRWCCRECREADARRRRQPNMPEWERLLYEAKLYGPYRTFDCEHAAADERERQRQRAEATVRRKSIKQARETLAYYEEQDDEEGDDGLAASA